MALATTRTGKSNVMATLHHERLQPQSEAPALTGNRCRCQSCGEFFNSVSVFDRHRAGTWMNRGAERRRLSTAQMAARGWLKNTAGFWIERARRNTPERLDHSRQSGDRRNPAVQAGGAP